MVAPCLQLVFLLAGLALRLLLRRLRNFRRLLGAAGFPTVDFLEGFVEDRVEVVL